MPDDWGSPDRLEPAGITQTNISSTVYLAFPLSSLKTTIKALAQALCLSLTDPGAFSHSPAWRGTPLPLGNYN